MGTTFVFLLSLTVAVILAVNPGFKLMGTRSGLDYLNYLAEDCLPRILKSINIPDHNFEDDDSYMRLSNIQILSISSLHTSISPTPSQNSLTLTVFDFSASATSNWAAGKTVFFFIPIKGDGTVDVSTSGASSTLTIGLENKNGRPSLLVNSCSASFPHVSVHFSGGVVAWIINLFSSSVENYLREILQKKVCDMVTSYINEGVNYLLSLMKMQIDVGPFILDYNLLESARVTGEDVETLHKGEFFWKFNSSECPFTPKSIPAWPEHKKMIYFALTQYLIDTFAYTAHNQDFLQYNLTRSTLPSDKAFLLNTTCEKSFCVGKIIPKLAEKYPNSGIEIRARTTDIPLVKITKEGVTLRASGQATVFVQKSEDNSDYLFTINMTLYFEAIASIKKDRLTGSISNHSFDMVFVESHLEEDEEQRKEMEKNLAISVQGLVRSTAIPYLNGIGDRGLSLIMSETFQFGNATIFYSEDVVFAGADVKVENIL